MKASKKTRLSVPHNQAVLGTLTENAKIQYGLQPQTALTIDTNPVGAINEPSETASSLVSDSVPKPSSDIGSNESGYVTVKELAARYGLSLGTLYALIKTEPTFPYKNVGLKKKFVVNVDAFEMWISERTEREKTGAFQIPTAAALIERYRK